MKLWVLREKTRPQNPEKEQEKKDILKNLYLVFDGRATAFENKIFPIKIEGTGFSDKVLDHFSLKVLTRK